MLWVVLFDVNVVCDRFSSKVDFGALENLVSTQIFNVFLQHGMGQMRITDSGIRVEGQTEFLQGLHTSGVHSPPVSTASDGNAHKYLLCATQSLPLTVMGIFVSRP